jgi:isovaleryl-CoA dehydrogenase
MARYDRKELRESVRAFAAAQLTDEVLRRIDEQDQFPQALIGELVKNGYLGIAAPMEYGGGGLGLRDILVVSEELSRASMVTFASVVSPAIFSTWRILGEGTGEQKKTLVPDIISGKLRMSGTAFTEPDAGSDLSALSTRATRTSGGWRISGTKTLIGGALEADLMMVLARIDERTGRDNLNMFMVPRPSGGLKIRKIPVMGSHGVSTCEIHFDNVEVGAAAVVGGEEALGKGWAQLTREFGKARLITAAICLGVAQRGLDLSVSFASHREQFGRPIGNFQSIAHLIADMATAIAAARSLLYDVADEYTDGVAEPARISMVKMLAAEVAKQTCIDGMQIFGGRGYAIEYDIERILRDSFLYVVGGGTPQIHRSTIAKSLGFRA